MEIWKDIPDYEGLYQISNLGRLKSLSKILKNRWGFYNSKEKIIKGNITKEGYVSVKLTNLKNESNFKIHSLVCLVFFNYKNSKKDNLVIDHINNIKNDNRLSNLQIITNRQNCSKDVKNKTSKHTGVSWDKNRKKWSSKIKIDNKTINLGRHKKEYDAHLAYQKALKELT